MRPSTQSRTLTRAANRPRSCPPNDAATTLPSRPRHWCRWSDPPSPWARAPCTPAGALGERSAEPQVTLGQQRRRHIPGGSRHGPPAPGPDHRPSMGQPPRWGAEGRRGDQGAIGGRGPLISRPRRRSSRWNSPARPSPIQICRSRPKSDTPCSTKATQHRTRRSACSTIGAQDHGHSKQRFRRCQPRADGPSPKHPASPRAERLEPQPASHRLLDRSTPPEIQPSFRSSSLQPLTGASEACLGGRN